MTIKARIVFVAIWALGLQVCSSPLSAVPSVPEARTIDVLVVYTSALETLKGGPDGAEAFVQGEIAFNNLCYENSLINARHRLVGVRKVDYVEASSETINGAILSGFSKDLAALREGTGALAKVHQWRDELGADVVSLFRKTDDAGRVGGIANYSVSISGTTLGERSHSAVSVIGPSVNSSYVHEIGHNLGCAHDRITLGVDPLGGGDASSGIFPYSYGYHLAPVGAEAKRYSTIMAYARNHPSGAGTRIPYFSNPNVNYPGSTTPTGAPSSDTANAADNARTINETVEMVAANRAHRLIRFADGGRLPSTFTSSGGAATLKITAELPDDPDSTAITYQWETSADGGATWTALPSITNTLALSGLTAADLGKLYRVTASHGGQTIHATAAYTGGIGFDVTPGRANAVTGQSLQFAATPAATGWNVIGIPSKNAGTTISAAGQLSISPGETARTLIVTATAADSKFTAAIVHVTRAAASAAGDQHSLWVKDGRVYAAGANDIGQLGLGTADNNSHSTPADITPTGITAVSVAANGKHGFFTTADGRLFALGGNGQGQLGTGNTATLRSPTPVLLPSDVFVVAVTTAGAAYNGTRAHTIVLARDGRIFAMGVNGSYQLGDGGTSTRLSPVEVTPPDTFITTIATGNNFTLLTTSDGRLLFHGNNSSASRPFGSEWPIYTRRASELPTPAGATAATVAISANSAAYFVTASGNLHVTGFNSNSELGTGDNVNKTGFVAVTLPDTVAAVAGGSFHALLSTGTGALYAAGSNSQGQLGDGTPTRRTVWTRVTPANASIFTIAAGWYHSLFAATSGTYYATGLNDKGQLGFATSGTRQFTPLAITFPSAPSEITVAFAPQGGDLGAQPASKTIAPGSPYGALPVPTLAGRTFLGWWTALDDGGVLITETTTVPGNATSHTLFAKWNIITSPPSDLASLNARQIVATGKNLTLAAGAAGVPSPVFQWQVSTDGGVTWINITNGSAYQGATTDMLTITAAAGLNGARYRYLATNTAGTGTSAALTLAVAPSTFVQPMGLVFDSSDKLYLTDYSRHTIQKITLSGDTGEAIVIAGKPGSSGFTNATGTNAGFYRPFALAFSGAGGTGDLLVADYGNHAIRKINTTTATVTTLASGTQYFTSPAGIAINAAGIAHVTDYGNHTISTISPAGAVTLVAGAKGVQGVAAAISTAARFYRPTGIAFDPSGYLYIADFGNHTIRTRDGSNTYIHYAGDVGVPGTNDGEASDARFQSPSGLATDTQGNIYIADFGNHTVRILTHDGEVLTLAGSPGVAGLRDGTGTAALFHNPHSLAFDKNGALYVADYANALIRKITFTGTTFASVQVTTILVTATTAPPAAQPVLSVTPATRTVGIGAGSTTFTLKNAGGGTLAWNASLGSGVTWTRITGAASGNLTANATTNLTLSYDANPAGSAARTAQIAITASGSAATPLTLTQSANAGSGDGGNSSGGGGGGSTSLPALALLGMLLALRLKTRK